MICTGCCATLDNIITYLFRRLMKKQKKNAVNGAGGGEPFLQVLELRPQILQQMLSTVLNIIMFEDCRNQWSMSRPLLGLILLNEEVRGNTVHSYYFVVILFQNTHERWVFWLPWWAINGVSFVSSHSNLCLNFYTMIYTNHDITDCDISRIDSNKTWIPSSINSLYITMVF